MAPTSLQSSSSLGSAQYKTDEKARLMRSEPLFVSSGDDTCRVWRPKIVLGVIGLVLMGAIVALVVPAFVGQVADTSSQKQKSDSSQMNFVTVEGTQFLDGQKNFYVSGVNIDSLVEAAIPVVQAKLAGEGKNSVQMIRDVLDDISSGGFNVIRTWAHTVDPAHPMQVKPGRYDESVLQALDLVIAESGKRGLRLILSFADSWRYRGGVMEYLDWSSTMPKRPLQYPPVLLDGDFDYDKLKPDQQDYELKRRAQFYVDKDARDFYKGHMRTLLNRKNTYNGIRYKDDPAIFAFGLLNEPRCHIELVPDCQEKVQTWLEEMTEYFRSIDTKHLLTIGEEGFYSGNEESIKANPGYSGKKGGWAHLQGQDFLKNHAIEGISYASIHAWPDNWNETRSFLSNWIDVHSKDSKNILGKPLLVEEVGKSLSPAPASSSVIANQRDPLVKSVQDQVGKSIQNQGALQGSLLWELSFKLYDASPYSTYGISTTDSTFEVAKQHSRSLRALAVMSARGQNRMQIEYWYGEESMVGFRRRCKAAEFKKSSPLFDPGMLVFASHSSCCRKGTGAFKNGCTY